MFCVKKYIGVFKIKVTLKVQNFYVSHIFCSTDILGNQTRCAGLLLLIIKSYSITGHTMVEKEGVFCRARRQSLSIFSVDQLAHNYFHFLYDQIPPTLRLVKGVCVFRCNLPPALFAKWPGSFTCHCGNTGMERTPNKSQHTKLPLEKKILPPLLPRLELATFRRRVQHSTNNYWRVIGF